MQCLLSGGPYISVSIKSGGRILLQMEKLTALKAVNFSFYFSD